MERVHGEEPAVRAVLAGALLLVLGQAVASRTVLAHLEAAVWLVPAWSAWVLAVTALVLRVGVLPGVAALLAGLHGLQHLGWRVAGPVHLAVEGGLAAVLVLALVARVVAVRRRERAALLAFLREPLPRLHAPLRGAFAAHAAVRPAALRGSTVRR